MGAVQTPGKTKKMIAVKNERWKVVSNVPLEAWSANPYTGWRTDCYATSLSMILNRRGHPKPIPYVDFLTTLPFCPFFTTILATSQTTIKF
jgi:hypothetical protein